MIEYKGQLKEYDFKAHADLKKRKHRKGAKESYMSQDIFTFDTETTSAWMDEAGKIIQYEPGRSSEYWNSLQPLALCYLWQFGVNDVVYYGRDISSFLEVLRDIPKEVRIIVWVHNLSFDAHFLFNILHGINAFCRTPHKPIKMVSRDFPNVEFRCSYMLTRLSLDTWGKSLGVKKLTGTVDYDIIRTPLTPLDNSMMKYAERDLIILYHGISDYVKRYGKVEDMPLTQTGTVRREIKSLLTDNDPGYMKFLKKLVPHNAKEYKMLRDVFAGGYTHANRLHAGVVQSGHIEHYDFASSYPTVMICEKYPYSPWIYTGLHTLPDEDTFEDTAYIMILKFTNIKCVTFNTYIQASKCDLINAQFDNGRVISADSLTIKITEQDYLTIKDTYKWDDLEVIRLYKSRKKYLPRKFIEYVMQLYENKTKLKGAPEGSAEDDLYKQSKQYINSLFGMMVTALIQSDVYFDENTLEWGIDTLTAEMVEKHLEKLRAWYPHEKRYFLNYSWGVWVTAYARRRLWRCILGEKDSRGFFKNDIDVLYADTDSIFILGAHNFDWYNKSVIDDLYKACDHYSIDHSRISPQTPKGVHKPLGIFEREDDIEEFITLGAKRYCERRATDHKLHLTISGINKGAVDVLEDNIKNFRDGLNFDKDDKSVKKKLVTYINDQPRVIWDDGYVSEYKSGINLRNNGYYLSISDTYKRLIKYISFMPAQLPENLQNHLRGRWREENNGHSEITEKLQQEV